MNVTLLKGSGGGFRVVHLYIEQESPRYNWRPTQAGLSIFSLMALSKS